MGRRGERGTFDSCGNDLSNYSPCDVAEEGERYASEGSGFETFAGDVEVKHVCKGVVRIVLVLATSYILTTDFLSESLG